MTRQHPDAFAPRAATPGKEGEPCTRAHLGLASTAEMLVELLARGEVEMSIRQDEPAEMRIYAAKLHAAAQALLGSLPADMLAYRTVEPDGS